MVDLEPELVHFVSDTVRLVGDRWRPVGPSRGTVLLAHGGGQTRNSWKDAGAAIAYGGWNAVAVDARGHGDSDWAPDGDYSVDALVSDLLNVVSSFDEAPVLVGASMGGKTGLIAEGEHPGTVRSLVLVDIAPKIERVGAERIVEFMLSAPDGFGSLEDVAEAIRDYQPHRARSVNLDGVRKNVRRGHDGRWYWHWDPAFIRPLANIDMAGDFEVRARAAAAKVRVPTMLVRGGLSDVVSNDGVDELMTLIPWAQYVTIPGAGHMVVGDDNSQFLGQLSRFLDGEGSARIRAVSFDEH